MNLVNRPRGSVVEDQNHGVRHANENACDCVPPPPLPTRKRKRVSRVRLATFTVGLISAERRLTFWVKFCIARLEKGRGREGSFVRRNSDCCRIAAVLNSGGLRVSNAFVLVPARHRGELHRVLVSRAYTL